MLLELPFQMRSFGMTFFGLSVFPFQSIIVLYYIGLGLFSMIVFLLARVYSNLESPPKNFFFDLEKSFNLKLSNVSMVVFSCVW